jgi:Rieske Fe-S protein
VTRKEYLIFQFSGTIALLLFACKDKNETIAPSKPEPVKKLNLTKVIPEKAVEGKTIQVFWETVNIKAIDIYERVSSSAWKLIAKDIDPVVGNFVIQLPPIFASNSTYAIKILGGEIESIKENIITEKIFLAPSIEIAKIEPYEAIAEEKLKVFFKTENIQSVLVELKNNKGDFLEVKTIDAKIGYYEFMLPNTFNLDDTLSINISGHSVFDLKEYIPTINLVKIDTNDFPELKIINGLKKVITSRGDVWLKRQSSNTMIAFSGACTHSGCGIDYVQAENNFTCFCHGSKFSLEGTVLNGPANLPLNQFRCLQVSSEEFKLIY